MGASMVAELSALGLTLAVRNGQVMVHPRRLVTPELRERISRNRATLIAELADAPFSAPLDDQVAAHFARVHTPADVDRRIECISARALRSGAAVRDIVLLDDWRRIKAAQNRR